MRKAELRLAGMRAIDPNLDFGNGLNAATFQTRVEALRDRLNFYNRTLATVDAARLDVIELERSVSELSERMLTGVAVLYGKDSFHYKMAGGTRRGDRKRPSRAAKAQTASADPQPQN